MAQRVGQPVLEVLSLGQCWRQNSRCLVSLSISTFAKTFASVNRVVRAWFTGPESHHGQSIECARVCLCAMRGREIKRQAPMQRGRSSSRKRAPYGSQALGSLLATTGTRPFNEQMNAHTAIQTLCAGDSCTRVHIEQTPTPERPVRRFTYAFFSLLTTSEHAHAHAHALARTHARTHARHTERHETRRKRARTSSTA
jgi:hypothetical protein